MERSSLLNQLCLIVLVLAPLCAFPAQAPEQAVANNRIVYWESDADDLRVTAIKPTDKKPHRLTAKISPKQLQTDIPVLLSPDGKWAAYPSTRLAGDDSPDEGIVHIRPLDKPEPRERSLAGSASSTSAGHPTASELPTAGATNRTERMPKRLLSWQMRTAATNKC